MVTLKSRMFQDMQRDQHVCLFSSVLLHTSQLNRMSSKAWVFIAMQSWNLPLNMKATASCMDGLNDTISIQVLRPLNTAS